MGKIDVEESLILDALVKRRSTATSDKQSAAAQEKNNKRDTVRKVNDHIHIYLYMTTIYVKQIAIICMLCSISQI